jgi:Sap, sulfolipid-1-addressing protein
VVGLLLLALAASAWRRKAGDPGEKKDKGDAGRGRIAKWSQRATTSEKWALVLGLVMFLPSPLYVLAVKDIADSGESSSSNVLAVLICAIGVMLFVEIPLAAMFIRPGGVAAGLKRFQSWLKRNGWSLAAGLALIGGIYAIVKGIDILS